MKNLALLLCLLMLLIISPAIYAAEGPAISCPKVEITLQQKTTGVKIKLSGNSEIVRNEDGSSRCATSQELIDSLREDEFLKDFDVIQIKYRETK